MSARPIVPTLFAAALVTLLAGCGPAASAGKMAACIQNSGRGWHRVTHAFQIRGLGHLDLETDWIGGPEEKEKGILEPYIDVSSLNPHVHFELAVLGGNPAHRSNQALLLKEVQTDPTKFERVLITNDAPQTRASASGVVENCSEKLYPHQGP
jgi:hypothetical protein